MLRITKKSKERVTILVRANAAENHKFPLLVIGKSKNPRALKHVNRNALLCKYINSTTAWMTSSIFRDWFYEYFVLEVTKFLKNKGLPLKAILLVDNAPSHPGNLRLSEIELIFLPSNVTSILQSMDKNVMETMKKNYKTDLLLHLFLQLNDNFLAALKSLNIKDIIYMISSAWNKVQEQRLSLSHGLNFENFKLMIQIIQTYKQHIILTTKSYK